MQDPSTQTKSREDHHLFFLKDKASFHFPRNGDYLRFTDWRFIHRARLSCVSLFGYMPGLDDDTKAFRECGWYLETFPLVLNNCNPNLHRGTRRHKIVARIKEAASRKWKIISENQFSVTLVSSQTSSS